MTMECMKTEALDKAAYCVVTTKDKRAHAHSGSRPAVFESGLFALHSPNAVPILQVAQARAQ